ncbi:hypothetical protein Tco_0135223 [Tanacetum coccineum]
MTSCRHQVSIREGKISRFISSLHVGIKILLMPLGVNIAKVRVTAVKHNLVLPVKNEENILSSYYCLYTVSAAGIKVNVAGMKVTTAERLQLLEEFLLTEG